MPLLKGKKNFSKNVSELRQSGYPEKQAVAIAYKEAGEDSDSNRIYDINGWFEIKGNPLSKVGVFPYAGHQISEDLEPDSIYQVYRPEEELSSEETISSFRLLPWIDDHAMLGSEDEGLLPAEQKGIQGIIGEEVYFEDGYLKGNLKVFSEKLAKLIQDNKKELSIGYRCVYDIQPGSFQGIKYDAIQREIRGNHVALVDEGRSGPDVSVLDKYSFTFDRMDLQMIENGENNKMPEMRDEGMEGVSEALQALQGQMAALHERLDLLEGKSKDEYLEVKEPLGMDEEKEVKDEEEKKMEDAEIEKEVKDEEEKKKDGMDARYFKRMMREVSARDALASKLSYHIGAFDHSDFTTREVAAYGAKKLGLRVPQGQEISAIHGYLIAAEQLKSPVHGYKAMDTSPASNQIDDYIKGAQ